VKSKAEKREDLKVEGLLEKRKRIGARNKERESKRKHWIWA
jgi:hypothetical protein